MTTSKFHGMPKARGMHTQIHVVYLCMGTVTYRTTCRFMINHLHAVQEPKTRRYATHHIFISKIHGFRILHSRNSHPSHSGTFDWDCILTAPSRRIRPVILPITNGNYLTPNYWPYNTLSFPAESCEKHVSSSVNYWAMPGSLSL